MRSKLWPYRSLNEILFRSRGNRSSVRLSILVCTAVVSLLTFLRLPQKTDWRLIFASEVETTNSTNGEASTFMSLATSLKTSKASYTGKENSTKSTSAEAIRQSTPSFMSDKPNRASLRRQIRAQGYFIPTDDRSRYANDNDIKSALNIVDAKMEVGKRELAAENESFDWKSKKFLLVVTTWRSGSTFLSEMLASHPAVFLHYEPLIYFGRHQVRENENPVALQQLKDTFNCMYTNKKYVGKIKRMPDVLVKHNVRIWEACSYSSNPLVCKEPSFLQAACQRFPVVVSKVVRLRLQATDELLTQFPNLKVLFLIRDPRALMNSRNVNDWGCGDYADCGDPKQVCADALNDLNALDTLSVSHPDRLMMVKYETLAVEPKRTFEEIFRFAGLPYLTSVDEIIRNRTTTKDDNPWSVYRNSSERINLWRTKLDTQSVALIQDACRHVLHRLNYSLV